MGLGGSKGAKDLGASEAMAVATASLQLLSSHNTLLHTSPDYRYEADYGPGGAALRALVDWYDYSDQRVAASWRGVELCCQRTNVKGGYWLDSD